MAAPDKSCRPTHISGTAETSHFSPLNSADPLARILSDFTLQRSAPLPRTLSRGSDVVSVEVA